MSEISNPSQDASYLMQNGERFSLPNPVASGEAKALTFAVIGLDHGHIFGIVKGLLGQGCHLAALATSDWNNPVAKQAHAMVPDVPIRSAEQVLADPDIDLVATAAIPVQRGPLAIAAMREGKDVITDKPGCTTVDQLDEIRRTVAETGRIWSVMFSERLEVPAARRASDLVREGCIGEVIQTLGMGPHREGQQRPDWFYNPEQYGGIITDIASHQFDQFLWYTGAQHGEVVSSTVANYAHPDQPGMNDFGDVMVRNDKGTTGYIRVDWFTPAGLPTWGDGRLFILGTKGYIELRKYVDIAGREGTDHLFWVDGEGVHYEDCADVVLDFYPNLVADIRQRTQTACPQEHTFEAMRLALTAQAMATRLGYLSH